MEGRASYTDQTKAAAMAALLQGQSVSSVAKEYRLPKGTVSGWKRQAEREASRPEGSEGVATTATQKSERIGALLMDYLEANLTALRAQVEAFSDPDWLARQNAADAAVLHGVMTDKAVRLLEALSPPEGD